MVLSETSRRSPFIIPLPDMVMHLPTLAGLDGLGPLLVGLALAIIFRTHTNFFVLLGMSSLSMAISEIGASFPDATFGKESRFGTPFTVSGSTMQHSKQSASVPAAMKLVNDDPTALLFSAVPIEGHPPV